LVVPYKVLTELQADLSKLEGTSLDKWAEANWINDNMGCVLITDINPPPGEPSQATLSVTESASSMASAKSGGTFQFNISRDIVKKVMVLYSVTDSSITGATQGTTIREALIPADSSNSTGIAFSSLFKNPSGAASALKIMSNPPSGISFTSTNFNKALTWHTGDTYKIKIEGYAVQYQNGINSWYFDSKCTKAPTDISKEKLMFGTTESVSFNATGSTSAAASTTSLLWGSNAKLHDQMVSGLHAALVPTSNNNDTPLLYDNHSALFNQAMASFGANDLSLTQHQLGFHDMATSDSTSKLTLAAPESHSGTILATAHHV
jgi:hypothetical protein